MNGTTVQPTIPDDLLNTYEVWNQYVADIWYNLFLHIKLDSLGSIVEIAPGTSPKIALALQKYKFSGTVIIVEPFIHAQKNILNTYQRLLPDANICAISLTLESCINQLGNVDVIVSHSPLDDMLITGKCDNQQHLNALFNWTQKTELTVEPYFKETWQNVSRNALTLNQRVNEIIDIWVNLLKNGKPKNCIISQYPSLVLKNDGLDDLNLVAQKILYQLKSIHENCLADTQAIQKILDQHIHYNFPLIENEVLNAKNWMVYCN